MTKIERKKARERGGERGRGELITRDIYMQMDLELELEIEQGACHQGRIQKSSCKKIRHAN